jgi:hypothetical protein
MPFRRNYVEAVELQEKVAAWGRETNPLNKESREKSRKSLLEHTHDPARRVMISSLGLPEL